MSLSKISLLVKCLPRKREGKILQGVEEVGQLQRQTKSHERPKKRKGKKECEPCYAENKRF